MGDIYTTVLSSMLVRLTGLVWLGLLPTVTIRVSRVNVMVSVRVSIK